MIILCFLKNSKLNVEYQVNRLYLFRRCVFLYANGASFYGRRKCLSQETDDHQYPSPKHLRSENQKRQTSKKLDVCLLGRTIF